jgi:hypothetical protein
MAPTPFWHRRRRETPVESEVIERLLDYTRAAPILATTASISAFTLEAATLRISSREAEKVEFWREFHGPSLCDRDVPPSRGVPPRGTWPPPRDVVRHESDVRKLSCDDQRPFWTSEFLPAWICADASIQVVN